MNAREALKIGFFAIVFVVFLIGLMTLVPAPAGGEPLATSSLDDLISLENFTRSLLGTAEESYTVGIDRAGLGVALRRVQSYDRTSPKVSYKVQISADIRDWVTYTSTEAEVATTNASVKTALSSVPWDGLFLSPPAGANWLGSLTSPLWFGSVGGRLGNGTLGIGLERETVRLAWTGYPDDQQVFGYVVTSGGFQWKQGGEGPMSFVIGETYWVFALVMVGQDYLWVDLDREYLPSPCPPYCSPPVQPSVQKFIKELGADAPSALLKILNELNEIEQQK